MENSAVEVAVSGDATNAQMISAELDARSIEHQLILASDPYVGLDHTSPHRIVVSADDEANVRQIVTDLQA